MTNANICAANDTVEVAIDMLKIRILSKSTGNKGAGSPNSRRTRVTPEAIPVAIMHGAKPRAFAGERLGSEYGAAHHCRAQQSCDPIEGA